MQKIVIDISMADYTPQTVEKKQIEAKEHKLLDPNELKQNPHQSFKALCIEFENLDDKVEERKQRSRNGSKKKKIVSPLKRSRN